MDELLRLSPVMFARHISIEPDDWQKDALKARDREIILNCCRQSGKSTTAAIKALHMALSFPNSTIVIISPTQRQSQEIFRMIDRFYEKVKEPPKKTKDTEFTMELENGSRIISMPGNESMRGIPAVDLLIEDEASRVNDEVSYAAIPMLAVKNGQHIMLSTPAGMRGHFYKACMTEGKKVYTIKAEDIPRISKEFLQRMRETMGSRIYQQEFECVFIAEGDMAMFRRFWLPITQDRPKNAIAVRAWDMASTQDGGDYTASCLMPRDGDHYYINEITAWQMSPRQNEINIRRIAENDPKGTAIRMEQEPGSSGVAMVDHYKRNVLPGFDFDGVPSTGSKALRAIPFSAACEAGKVSMTEGKWNEQFLEQLVEFPYGEHDDMVDAAALAFNTLSNAITGSQDRLARMIVR